MLTGPRFVSHEQARCFAALPEGLEPDTVIVPGIIGELEDYSIIVWPTNPLRAGLSSDWSDPNGLGPIPDDQFTYEVCYTNRIRKLVDLEDPNTACVESAATEVQIEVLLPAGLVLSPPAAIRAGRRAYCPTSSP